MRDVGKYFNKLDNEELKNIKGNFISRFEKESEENKKRIHYQSALNMAEALLIIKNKRDSRTYKESVGRYMNKVIEMDFPIDRLSSLKLFNYYLYPTAKYLMYKADFTSNTDFQRSIGFGFFLDLAMYWFIFPHVKFYLPIFTILFLIRGRRKKNLSIKKNKYFNTFY